MPLVKVRRGGQVSEVSSRELVPGDVVLLEAGNYVPADCRIIEAANLRIQEAALTGESEPTEKASQAHPGEDLALGDRHGMAFMGTVVTYGRGTAVVTETGMKTELGAIATMIQKVESEATPLQRRLEQLGKGLALAALAVVTVIFIEGLITGGTGVENLREMFLTAVSMAVAAVPEGLPAVVTIALALGAQRMLKRRALIRKLLAVETLGSVTVICSDKTGTLTENRMTVTVLDVAGHRLELSEVLHRAAPAVCQAEVHESVFGERPAMALLLAGGALCNDAVLRAETPDGVSFQAVGDPTEGALVVAAYRMGLAKERLEAALPRVQEAPFDSERKRMTTVHALPKSAEVLPEALRGLAELAPGGGEAAGRIAFTKGAVDGLMQISTAVWVSGRAEPLTEELRRRIMSANDELAAKGMRILGTAFRRLPGEGPTDPAHLEEDLTLIGLVGMIDPPRAEVKEAVATCRSAGIRPIMITGDHPLTAQHVARLLGIADERHGRIVTGRELDKMTPAELTAAVEEVSVFARVSPEHKLSIVQALQSQGHVVAMTGDGVNDAPALKKADIGVAMGITGTDVSKEASDMVLQDDNFATIVAAVEEGRVIYDNIRKFIKYLLSTNSAELWVMLLAPLLGMPLPLVPLQILWMNLVTDGLPALALSLEPAERNTMRRPPRRSTESIFSHGLGVQIIWVGLVMALVSLGVAWFDLPRGALAGNAGAIDYWRTIVFTVLVLVQMALALAFRSERESLFRIGLRSNKAMIAAVLLTVAMQMAVIYVPALQTLFRTAALGGRDLAVCFAASTIPLWAVEIEKLIRRRAGRARGE